MLVLLAFILAMSITAVVIPVLARWAPSIGLTDRPGPRKLHSQPVPRVGGIAMALGFLLPAVLLIQPTPALRGLLAGMLVLLVVGVWDDRFELNYRVKFAGQLVAVALCMGLGGVYVQVFPAAPHALLPQLASLGLTFLFLIGVTNAVNLSDGLDGLAGGMALLCFCAVALLAAAKGNLPLATLAVIEGGALLGFLRFNTYPARIFMGDGGSQVLGLMIAVLAILSTQDEIAPLSAALPLLLVGMPIIDTLTVIVHRIRHGRSPFTGDRNHLHHRLLGLGFSHGEAVILLYLLQVLLFLLAYFLRFGSDLTIVGVFTAFGGLLVLAMHRASRSGWRAHARDEQARRSWVGESQRLLRPVPTLALWVMLGSMLVYAVIVIAASDRVGGDVTILCLLLLALLLVSSLAHTQGAVGWPERVASYVGVVLLVYLDQTDRHSSRLLADSSWTLLGITGAAALMRFLLSPVRRFELTARDVLVVFIALVVPNLPGGALELPPDLPAGIAKAVILLYVVEMLLGLELQRRVARTCLALMLTAIAARGLLTLGI